VAADQWLSAGLLQNLFKRKGKEKMKRNIKSRLIAFILMAILLPVIAVAQQSAKTLSAAELATIVRQYHPVAKQANIGIDMAAADIMIAKGGFDPLLQVSSNRKTFDGINYYNYTEPELKIPTWYGVEVYAGAESLSGSRTDPQETQGRTSYAGISVPLLKNLLMDKRRAALLQAKIFRSMSEVERQSTINNLQLDAITVYWKWVQYYQVYAILKDAVLVNERRLTLVKNAYKLGDRPAIDTVEALTQLQQFQYLQNAAFLDFQNTGVELSAYLWQQNNQPYILPDGITPDMAWQKSDITAGMIESEEALINMAAKNHPDLRQYNFKLSALQVEKKLKFQELLPVMNLKYNQLGKGYNLAKTITTPLFENNYRFGVSFAVPLRLSQGRGEYRKAKLKILDTEYDLQNKQVLVYNKIKMYRNEALMLLQQVALQQRALLNYQTLLRGEETRFFNGESSLFLVNARETKTLEATQKLVEVKVKLLKTVAGLQWAAGLLN
jgi:outer membrane protein TolC